VWSTRRSSSSRPRSAEGALAALALALGLAAGCRDRAQDQVTPTPSSSPPPPDAEPAPSAAALADARAPLPWALAIRRGEWDEAERGLAALPEAEQKKPEVRYARARVALMRAQYKNVVAALEGLEPALPLLSESIQRTRAEAELEIGPYDRAADVLARAPGAAAQLRAARAYDRAGAGERAALACERVLVEPKRTADQEEEARALHLRLATDAGKRKGDARWLAVHAISEKNHKLALAALDAPLEADAWLTRAHVLAGRGRADDALTAVDRATAAGASELATCRARAEVVYKAKSRHGEASMLYAQCSQKGGPHAAEDAFLSARALLRADRDAEAIVLFGQVEQKHPKSPWAEQAAFLAARAMALHGRWAEAAKAFDDYVARHPRGTERREADRYRAISHLMAKHTKKARQLFEEASQESSDPVLQARYMNLAALAALADGDRLVAIARFTEVARTRPLTWPALVARARLTAAGAPLPPTIEPAEGGPGTIAPEVVLPAPADMLHRVGLDDEAEDALREREGTISAAAGARSLETLCATYKYVDRARRMHQIAQQIPAAMVATAPGPKNRWAWECLFPRPFSEAVEAAEHDLALPPGLVYAVMRQESGFDPRVISPANAVGLMQLLPETAKTVAEAAKLPHEEAWLVRGAHNTRLGALYLKELGDRFLPGRTPLGAAVLAVGGYNAGPEALDRWSTRAKGAPLDVLVELIPYLETRGYVVRVMGNLARYGYLAKGEEGVPKITLGDLP